MKREDRNIRKVTSQRQCSGTLSRMLPIMSAYSKQNFPFNNREEYHIFSNIYYSLLERKRRFYQKVYHLWIYILCTQTHIHINILFYMAMYSEQVYVALSQKIHKERRNDRKDKAWMKREQLNLGNTTKLL